MSYRVCEGTGRPAVQGTVTKAAFGISELTGKRVVVQYGEGACPVCKQSKAVNLIGCLRRHAVPKPAQEAASV
jgi:hypothetical protein